MPFIYPDVSEFQVAANDSFNRQFVMFRAVNDPGRLDFKASQNLAWAASARARGRIANFGVYVIPVTTSIGNILARLDQLGVPRDCVVMIDMESWGGQVRGNQSVTCNALAEALRTRQNGRSDLVWGYGNRGDLASIWPSRPSWLGVIVAAYGQDSISAPGVNMIGWQYCSTGNNRTSWPSSTAPFGPCDHNALFGNIPLPGGGGLDPSGGGTILGGTLTEPSIVAAITRIDGKTDAILGAAAREDQVRRVRAIRDNEGGIYVLGAQGFSHIDAEQHAYYTAIGLYASGSPEQMINDRARDLEFMIHGTRGDLIPEGEHANQIDYAQLAQAILPSLTEAVKSAIGTVDDADATEIAQAVADKFGEMLKPKSLAVPPDAEVTP